jgi:hypothetical protein
MERKNWLYAFTSYTLASLVCSISPALSTKDTILLIVQLSFILISALATYYFSYRKFGTKWLSFLMFLIPYGIMMNSMNLSIALLIWYGVFILPITLWFWILSAKLLSQYQKMQTKLSPHTSKKALFFLLSFAKDENYVINGLLSMMAWTSLCFSALWVTTSLSFAIQSLNKITWLDVLELAISCAVVPIVLFFGFVSLIKGPCWIARKMIAKRP